jgi:hypothetical protein
VHETTTKLGTTVEIGNAGGMVAICKAMVNSLWHPLLEALSFMLERSQGEVIVGEVLKGYQAFTKACGILTAIEPRDTFLASLGRFTFSPQMRANISWYGYIMYAFFSVFFSSSC